MKTSKDNNNRLHLLLLLVWLVIGVALRFTNLDLKPASSIEIATLGFSLGHGFSQIPLDQVISASTLLSPLRFDGSVSSTDVIEHLMSESTHPPLYFWLTFWWTKLFVGDGELVSLFVGRSLSAIFGSLAIPAIFGLSWLAFRDRIIPHLAALLMAVSPYGIYLAQETRHYTLTILWVIASLSCLILATQHIYQRIKLPIWVVCIWVLVNSLGIATHYFFSLALGAEGLVVLGLLVWDYRRRESTQFSFSYWWPIVAVGFGTLVGCLVWLPVVSGISSNQLTDWIETSFDLDEIWQPIPRLIIWLITMVMMLPVEGTSLVVTVISALVILSVLIWIIPALVRGWKSSLNSSIGFPLRVLGGYWLAVIMIFFVVIYGLGKDISLAARYHFVYFPAVIVLIAVALAHHWQNSSNFYAIGKKVVVVLVFMGFLGSLTVVNNLGFQKSRNSDRLAAHIQANATVPTLVAMTYDTHSQLRELIALTLSFERLGDEDKSLSPEFLLVRRDKEQDQSFATLSEILRSRTASPGRSQPKPLNLWGINLKIGKESLSQLNCTPDKKLRISNTGYRNRFYFCR